MTIFGVCIKLLFFYCLPSYGFFTTTTNTTDNNFKIWQKKCNCSCAVKHDLFYSDCSTRNVFKVTVTNNNVLLMETLALFNLSEVQYKNLECEEDLPNDDSTRFMIYIKCLEDTFFAFLQNTTVVGTPVVFRETPFNSVTQHEQPTRRSTLAATPFSGGEEEAKRFIIMIIGLCTGLSLVAIITITIICVRKRARRKQEKSQQDDYENINEEDDSLPYRIVDLSTNISCDSSGYTFLKGQRECEEKPYQKLTTTQPSSCSEESQSANSNVIRQETGVKVIEEDEPVYFMLEGKSELNV